VTNALQAAKLRGKLFQEGVKTDRKAIDKSEESGGGRNGKEIFEGEENFVGDSEIIALGGASNETKDRPLG
jgi:hypothetical protein